MARRETYRELYALDCQSKSLSSFSWGALINPVLLSGVRMHVWGPQLRDGRLNLVRTTWSSVVRRRPRGIFGVDSDEMDVENAVNHATNSLDQFRAHVACNSSSWRASRPMG